MPFDNCHARACRCLLLLLFCISTVTPRCRAKHIQVDTVDARRHFKQRYSTGLLNHDRVGEHFPFTKCGRAPLNPLTKHKGYILGGESQNPEEWPQLVLIWTENTKGPNLARLPVHGTLVSDRHVITSFAAIKHSTDTGARAGGAMKPTRPMRVSKVGQDYADGISVHIVRNFMVGGEYNIDYVNLELEKPFELDDQTQPACPTLGRAYTPTNGTRAHCFLVGAGPTDQNGFKAIKNNSAKIRDSFRTVHQLRVHSSDCDGHQSKYTTCFESTKGHPGGPCLEEGAPVLCLDWLDRWTLVGIASKTTNQDASMCSVRKKWTTTNVFEMFPRDDWLKQIGRVTA